ncbi:MAG TPA: hypothetical protein VFJ02_06405 [Vicinamibacterales bacterium]|nr:hypothetical protein [Vicinamibacterales bacterium]
MSVYTWPAAAFVVIPVVLAVLLAAGTAAAWIRSGEPWSRTRRATLVTIVLTVMWMEATWMAAANGTLRNWNRVPPPFLLFVVAIFAIAVGIAFSPYGRRLAAHLPVWLLVLVQVFRFPLELAMHGMYERGVMPVQMSYSGMNFDIVTGLSALVVARLAASRRGGPRLVLVWNVLGVMLLANVVTIAILSTPKFAYFGAERLNVWVTYPPYVWLPAVMVLAALAGHLLIFRALRLHSAARPR